MKKKKQSLPVKVKRVGAGAYLVTDTLGRVYDVHDNEGSVGGPSWTINVDVVYDADNPPYCDTANSLRQAKEWIAEWALRDTQQQGSKT